MNQYVVDTEQRQRWAYVVRYNGMPIARCDSARHAERVAKALNIAMAASLAAASPVNEART